MYAAKRVRMSSWPSADHWIAFGETKGAPCPMVSAENVESVDMGSLEVSRSKNTLVFAGPKQVAG